jgi:hypothetical protein
MAELSLARETNAFKENSAKLDRMPQVLRPVPDAAAAADMPEISARERIKGHEQDLLEWLAGARRWLQVVDEHLVEHAPRALVKEESNALWTGTQQLRGSLLNYVFANDSTLGQLSPEWQEGAELRHSDIEEAYRNLMKELEPYRELWQILDQNPGWKETQTPTEIRTTVRQRTADAERIRDLFAEYRTFADALLVNLKDLVEAES